MKKRKLSWKWLIIVSLVFALFTVFVLPQVLDYSNRMIGQSNSPDTSLIYSSEDLYAMAQAYGEGGRAIYIKLRWTFDVIWPFVYTLFLLLWIIKLSEYIPKIKGSRYLFLLPIIGMLLDFLENTGATIVMFRYPQKSGIIASISPIMTFLKWISLTLSFILVVVLIIITLIKKNKGN